MYIKSDHIEILLTYYDTANKFTYGGITTASLVSIDDSNRKEYFALLMSIYSTERKYLDSKRRKGISESAKAGHYKGRKKIKLDKLAFQEIFSKYEAKNQQHRSSPRIVNQSFYFLKKIQRIQS